MAQDGETGASEKNSGEEKPVKMEEEEKKEEKKGTESKSEEKKVETEESAKKEKELEKKIPKLEVDPDEEKKVKDVDKKEEKIVGESAHFPSPMISAKRAKPVTLPMLNNLEFRVGPTVDLYPLENYTFDTKLAQKEKDKSVRERQMRMEVNYKKRGRRETVEGVLLAHDHGHPHVLMLQINAAFFKLPGGRLRPGENEVKGLKRKLTSRLASIHEAFVPKWEIGDLLSVWWRPTFEPFLYPYNPPHVSAPKERRRIYLVPLPEKCLFAVPSNLKLRAVPLFELYDNANRYGPIISSLPQLLSRYHFNIIN